MIDINKKELEKYLKKGLTNLDLAKIFNCSERTIARYLKKNTLQRNNDIPQREKRITAITLIEKGYSYRQIAEKLNICVTTVYLWNKQEKAKKSL